jgi:hypothetical protein
MNREMKIPEKCALAAKAFALSFLIELSELALA